MERRFFYYAMLMSREGSFGAEADLDEIVTELETAVALDPSLADAYVLLGFTAVRQHDSAKGIEAMKKAVSLRPRNEHYQYNLAQLYLSNRQPSEALAILHNLERTQDPALAGRVRQTIAMAERAAGADSASGDADTASGNNRPPTTGNQRSYTVQFPEPSVAQSSPGPFPARSRRWNAGIRRRQF